MNTYTHLGLGDDKDEMIRMEELMNAARAEVSKTTGTEKPVGDAESVPSSAK